jgi:hypothetical protein
VGKVKSKEIFPGGRGKNQAGVKGPVRRRSGKVPWYMEPMKKQNCTHGGKKIRDFILYSGKFRG